MTVQKFINYKIFNNDGTILNDDSQNKFKLKIIEKSSNYLVYKDILYINFKINKVLFQQK